MPSTFHGSIKHESTENHLLKAYICKQSRPTEIGAKASRGLKEKAVGCTSVLLEPSKAQGANKTSFSVIRLSCRTLQLLPTQACFSATANQLPILGHVLRALSHWLLRCKSAQLPSRRGTPMSRPGKQLHPRPWRKVLLPRQLRGAVH